MPFPASNNTGLQDKARGQARVMTATIEPAIVKEHLPSAWARCPLAPTGSVRVPVPGHTMHVGWFTAQQDPNKVLLLSAPKGPAVGTP
ncbi:hypothetical protein AB0O75_10020 [Streptomyces sp. NPDC088921]|uniref:hypothetical protein n=1 Tax=unclassified Streptomyces TaxID=2593676 RepID=UPI00343571D2